MFENQTTREIESRIKTCEAEVLRLEGAVSNAHAEWIASVETGKNEAKAHARRAECEATLQAAREKLAILRGALSRARKEALPEIADELRQQLNGLSGEAVARLDAMLSAFDEAVKHADAIRGLGDQHDQITRAIYGEFKSLGLASPSLPVFGVNRRELTSFVKERFSERYRELSRRRLMTQPNCITATEVEVSGHE